MSKAFTSDKTDGMLYYIVRNYSFESDPKGKYPGISEDDWKDKLEKFFKDIYDTGVLEYMVYILHDKDVDDNGGLTAIHYHLIVRFHKSINNAKVAKLFEVSSAWNCQNVNNGRGASRYLIHISDSAIRKEKFIYDIDDPVSYGIKYRDIIKDTFWNKPENQDDPTRKISKEKALVLVNDLALRIKQGEIRKDDALKELEEKAGYYWVRMYRNSFDDDVSAFIKNKVDDMRVHGRRHKTLYIMGAGGIGKSYLGRKLGAKISDGQGLYTSAPLGMDKTPDALNHYVDEKVAVFDEISPRGWTLDEFLGCFDPYSYVPFPSRNSNKDFVGDTSIFTNSISPLRFAKDLVVYSKGGKQYQDPADSREIDKDNADALDKYWQSRRRFENIIILIRDEKDHEKVNGYVFNLRQGVKLEDGSINGNDGAHILVGQFNFKNELGQEPVITDDILDNIEKLFKVNVSDRFKNVVLLDDFLEKHGMVETSRNEVIESFVDEVISKCVWDLLPANFIYDLYVEFRKRYFPSSDLLNRNELLRKLENFLEDWERKFYSVQVWGHMDKDEPLITEYNLERWFNQDYIGSNVVKKREFKRQNSYRGFLRK